MHYIYTNLFIGCDKNGVPDSSADETLEGLGKQGWQLLCTCPAPAQAQYACGYLFTFRKAV